ncbi:MAG: hypothetical protein JWR51_4634 [Devosia sp.]|uniref:hypothetical protein n=1 Tax=Devosia sp. TaxID=1871048 RepID=UPI0026370B40|nr:hypothetical protein [Devosia sp.]MDB5531531.1 hypothetical protein [Devosia sp.]
MVKKPISQNVTVSDESGDYRIKVNSDGSIDTNASGSGPGGIAQVEILDSLGNPLTYNANGQATMASSSPVVIASNQSAVASNITQTGGNVLAVDDAAAGTTVPVPVGGRVSTTYPTYSNGDRTQQQFSTGGELIGNPRVSSAALTDTFSNTAAQPLGITTTAGTTSQSLRVLPMGFNGTDWDRVRLAGPLLGLLVENGPYVFGRVTADGQIKGSAGFIHTITITPTGAVTAGVLTVYNSTTETGTVVASFSLPVTTFTPFSVTLDVACSAGIFVGFDATLANVGCTVSYR